MGRSGSIQERARRPRPGTRRRTAPASSNPRARQRALAIGIVDGREPGEEPLAELKELLRTAGVATAGEATQQRPQPDPDRYFGRGRLEELKARDRRLRRQPRRLRRRARPAPGAQPRGGARRAGDRPHGGDPRHLRRPRPLGRGQAPGRARAARVQHGPHAGSVDPPRAPRRRRMDGGIGTRGPGESQIETDRRLARDRIVGAAAPPGPARAQPRRDAGAARALLAAAGRPRRLHERRQVDAAERADRRRGRGGGPALPHARPDHPQPRALRPRLPAHRHGRLHREAAPPAGRGLQGDARGDGARRPRSSTSSTPPSREERRQLDMRAVDEVLEEIGAGEKPRLLVLNKADLLGEEEREEVGLAPSRRGARLGGRGEGLDELRERVEAAFEETLAEVELLVPYAEGARLHELHEVAGSLERTDREDGVLVHAKVPVAELHRFDDLPLPAGMKAPRSDPLASLAPSVRPGAPSPRSSAVGSDRWISGQQAEGGRDPADPRPRGRRGARPLRLRGGPPRPRRALERRHRDRGRDPRRARRPRPAPLGPRPRARHLRSSTAPA